MPRRNTYDEGSDEWSDEGSYEGSAGWSPEEEQKRHWIGWGRSPRPLLLAGLALATLAASLGLSWFLEGIRSVADLNGPHQQWRGVVVEHQQGTLLSSGLVMQRSLVVGFIDAHNPSATFTVQVDADIYSAVADGMLISLDLGPQTEHVYGLSTSKDGVTWSHQDLDPGGAQLRLFCWLLLSFGSLLLLLGLLGVVLLVLSAADLLGGTDMVSGLVVDVVEGSFWHLPYIMVDCGAGPLKALALRQSMYERVCEDGGRSQTTFVVSRLLHHVRRAKRHRSGERRSGALGRERLPNADEGFVGRYEEDYLPRQSRQFQW
jgi:hypothetical protein